MDSDPVDPGSSSAKRHRGVAVADSSDEEAGGRPGMSRQSKNGHDNGYTNGRTKRRKTLPSSPEVEESDDEDARLRRARRGKRRADNGGYSESEEEEDDEGQNGEASDRHASAYGRPLQPQYRPEYERHPDGYVTGSITKIKLIDFMTYDFVEFTPGPHLNMILGPNGTGKSTVAAGIAIGLGFKPEIMGRATDLKSYVKQGKEEAWTEITVRSKPGKRDHVIWRRFTKEEKSEWKLNGQPCTKKAVLEVVGGYGIQANNLCCFLAQDRVAEFAKMSPPLTLKETMRAAGDPRLTEWHQQLVVKGDEKKKLEERLVTDISRRDQVQGQLDQLAPEVERFENRQELEMQHEVLELLVEAAKAHEIRKEHASKSEEQVALVKEIKELERRNKPLTDLGKEYNAKLQKALQKSERNNGDIRQSMKDIKSSQNTLQEKIEKCGASNEQFTNLKRRIKRRENTKKQLEERKAKAEDILADAPTNMTEEINAKNREKNEVAGKLQQAKSDEYALKDQDRNLDIKLANIGRGIDDKMKARRELESVEQVRERAAVQANPSIGYALDWIRNHETEFESPVGKPPMISVNVTRPEYAWQVEQCLTHGQRSTFVTQTRQDYELLLSLNNRKVPSKTLPNGQVTRGFDVRLHVVRLDVTEANQNPQRICSDRDLQALGLDGVAIDYVEADEVVKAFLNENCNLHRAAVTQRSSDTLNSDEIAKVGFWTWLTKEESIRATRSRYGSRAYQISAQPGQPARFLNRVVDQAAVDKLAEEIANLKREKVDCEGPRTQLREDIGRVQKKIGELAADEMRLKKEIDAIRDRSKARAKAQTDINMCKEELEKIAREPSEAAERDRLIAEKMATAQACIPSVAALTTEHTVVIEQADDLITSGLRLAQVHNNSGLIGRKKQETEKTVDKLRRNIADLKTEIARLSLIFQNRSQAFGAEIGNRSEAVQAEVNARITAYGDDFPKDELENELSRASNDLELSEGISSHVVDRYRRYTKDLASVTKEVQEQEEDLRKVTKAVTTILAKFEPALDNLVNTISRRFSIAFDRNGCAGDVRLDKDDRGYEYWGLIPYVSFRDAETMQALTGQRQSGGERSYSTIMYLMALSEMARVPFSLVDEINQGMDQQAERTVFNQLVETTCDENAGQYFLITPKLLTGLTYHERMKVLIVNNGCWLPEGTDTAQKFGDLKGCLARMRQNIAAR